MPPFHNSPLQPYHTSPTAAYNNFKILLSRGTLCLTQTKNLRQFGRKSISPPESIRQRGNRRLLRVSKNRYTVLRSATQPNCSCTCVIIAAGIFLPAGRTTWNHSHRISTDGRCGAPGTVAFCGTTEKSLRSAAKPGRYRAPTPRVAYRRRVLRSCPTIIDPDRIL